MKNLEFQQGLEILKKQWAPSQFGQSRVEQMWEMFKNTRDGAFLDACRALVFEGGPAPTGSKIQDFVRAKALEFRASTKTQVDCDKCSGSGAILAFKRIPLANGRYTQNTCVAACSCTNGQELFRANKIRSVYEVSQLGYRPRGHE